jgi:hypothetical protein
VKKGYEVNGRYSQDPIGSDKPRGKNRSMRKHRNDAGLTPTETHRKAQLMRQFLALDGPKGASLEYINSPIWCPSCSGRRMRLEAGGLCEYCATSAAPSH